MQPFVIVDQPLVELARDLRSKLWNVSKNDPLMGALSKYIYANDICDKYNDTPENHQIEVELAELFDRSSIYSELSVVNFPR